MPKTYHVAMSDRLNERPIEAIKTLRRVFGLSLMNAKQQVDDLRPIGQSMVLTDEDVYHLEQGGFVVMNSTLRTVQIFRENDGKKINAIKDLRYCTGWGLKETKDIMDLMWRSNKPVDIGVVNGYTVAQLKNCGFNVIGWVEECFKDNEDLFKI